MRFGGSRRWSGRRSRRGFGLVPECRCGGGVRSARTSAARIRDADALARRRVWQSPHRLSFGEREEIFAGVCRDESDSEIARGLGRHRATIGREIRRCGGRERYRPLGAERLAERLARRPKQTNLAGCPRLLAAVEQGLERRWSPQQIAARLRSSTRMIR